MKKILEMRMTAQNYKNNILFDRQNTDLKEALKDCAWKTDGTAASTNRPEKVDLSI